MSESLRSVIALGLSALSLTERLLGDARPTGAVRLDAAQMRLKRAVSLLRLVDELADGRRLGTGGQQQEERDDG